MTQDERREMLRRYDGEIRTLDAEIGELLRALDDLDLTDYTLVFVASDHGEEFLDHGSWGHANVLYDELLHVPLIVRYPGSFEGGRVVDAPVSLVDVYSTVAAITGLSTRRVQGVPLHDTMAECSSRTGLAASTLRLRAYRDRTWKIIVPRDRGEPELFRYTTDPGERHDLAREYPEKLRELLRSAEELRTDRFFSETASDPAAHALSPETRRELETLGYAD